MSDCLPVCWIILHSYQPVFKSHFTFTFQQNLWLPTYIFPWWNRKNIWTSEKLQDSVSLPVWTQANFSFEHEVLFGHFASWFWHVSDTEDSLWAQSVIWAFCQLILTCIWHQRQFVSTEYHLGILSIGSDVYLMSRTICEHGVLFGHFCQLIWHESTIEGQFVNAECYLGILPIDLTCVMSGTVCVGQVFIWSSSWGTCDSSVFWCVSIYSICVTGVIAVFCKTGTTGSIHEKKINNEIMNKLNIVWLTVSFRLQRNLVKVKLFWNLKTYTFCIHG